MNKQKKGRKLSRKRDQRRALLKIMAANLILQERIKTTLAKAKETAVFAEKAITKAKKADLNSIKALSRIFPEKAVKKLIKELGPRYQSRPGGYTRILKLGRRVGDASPVVIIELVK